MSRRLNLRPLLPLALSVAMTGGCTEDGDLGHGNDTEVISRVELVFTPEGGGAALTFAFSDPDGDGGVSGAADRIELAADTTYSLEIHLGNELADPPVDITAEVAAEAESHMLFIGGEQFNYSYDDLESDYGEDLVGDDLPVGLLGTVNTGAAGSGGLRVVLRHLPALNGVPQKSADLPQLFRDGGDLPGEVDVDVSFELVLQ